MSQKDYEKFEQGLKILASLIARRVLRERDEKEESDLNNQKLEEATPTKRQKKRKVYINSG
ncbi:hypothetical protein OAO01_03940 [Oligoflexia bacterium]|nr:hypothetical protein [Oligoflexia bacterium]